MNHVDVDTFDKHKDNANGEHLRENYLNSKLFLQ